MPKKFSFKLAGTRQGARAGVMTTAHGLVETPIFMPVGTVASVKSLDSADLTKLGAQIILGNTYHLYLRPGTRRLQEIGGLHRLMNFPQPILTDSGGFQVFSLPDVKIDDDGVTFKSHLNGERHRFTPESALEIQREIGADIIMAFDHCTPDDPSRGGSRPEVEAAWDRTWDWTQRSFERWEAAERQSVYGDYQAFFGIAQGSREQDLRIRAVENLKTLDFDGFAIGGETIGFNMAVTADVLDWLAPHLPLDKPRYTMGLGQHPQDLVTAVMGGADMFDCVAPTRIARNGSLYHGRLVLPKKSGEKPYFASVLKEARLRIGQGVYATDQRAIMSTQDELGESCDCATCAAGYSRAYLHHLYKTKELSYYRLASIHNLAMMLRVTSQLRAWILDS